MVTIHEGQLLLTSPAENTPPFSCFHQHQQESHHQAAASLTAELRDLRLQLRKSEKERRQSERVRLSSRDDWEAEEGNLMDNLARRDRLIQVAERILLLFIVKTENGNRYTCNFSLPFDEGGLYSIKNSVKY